MTHKTTSSKRWTRILLRLTMLASLAWLSSAAIACGNQCTGGECEGELEVDPNVQTKGTFEAATASLAAGEYPEAVRLYTKVIEKDPRNRDAYHNRAISYGAQRKFYPALDDFEEALELGEEDPEIYYNLGSLYAQQALYPQALKAFNRALELDENHRGARLNLANATAAYKKYEEAVGLYEEFLRRFPESAEAYTNLGSAYEALGEDTKAEEYYQLALSKKADDPTTYLAIGHFMNSQKRHDEAIAAWQRYLELQPEGVDARKVRSFIDTLKKKKNPEVE